MGAVKTAKRKLCLIQWPVFAKVRRSKREQAIKQDERESQRMGWDGLNNIRKMAGLPMIRRAKS